MRSIYAQALGEQFDRLHPRIQQRFGFNSTDRLVSIGRGVMDRIWYAKWAAIPLQLGTTRHILFPQGGEHIPFEICNAAYKDQYGRETVTWNRTFQFPQRQRRFDATMIYSSERQRIVDYLGTRQHLAVDLALSVAPNGGICIRSGDQRFYEGWLQFPFPRLLTGVADVCEWYDDAAEKYRISVRVTNPLFGKVFHYTGTFEAVFYPVGHIAARKGLKPLREEWRE